MFFFFYKHWHDVISHVPLLISDCIYLILTPGISCQAQPNWTEDVLPFYYDCVYKAKQQRTQAFASYNKGFNSHTHQSSIGIKWPIKHDIAALRPCNLPISMCSESVDFKLHTCFLNCVDRPTKTRLLLSKYIILAQEEWVKTGFCNGNVCDQKDLDSIGLMTKNYLNEAELCRSSSLLSL